MLKSFIKLWHFGTSVEVVWKSVEKVRYFNLIFGQGYGRVIIVPYRIILYRIVLMGLEVTDLETKGGFYKARDLKEGEDLQ